jgi:uncharacterized Fe-S cluster protein YjdI
MAESTDPRGRTYCGQQVTVYYDARRCTHFAECVRGAPDVFDVHNRPWAQPDNGSAEFVAEVIRRCGRGGSWAGAGIFVTVRSSSWAVSV